MSAYYADLHPAPRWALSTHNVDSELLRDVARALPPGPQRLRGLVRAAAMVHVERTQAPRADVVLAVSSEDAAYYEQLGATPLLVPNGVDDALLDAPVTTPNTERVLFFGQLDYPPNARGLRRFVTDGWPRLRALRPDATLRVVGPGTAPQLEAEGVELAGRVDDIGAELAASALVIVPLWEGGGTRLKVLEALAAGRPVVSTPLGAAGIGFGDQHHGLLAAEPRALAEAAAAVLGDPALAARLAADGRRLAERFRWRKVTAPATALYAEWVSSAAAARRY